jgi:predicted ester cyclase
MNMAFPVVPGQEHALRDLASQLTGPKKGELMGIPASNRFVFVDNIDVIAFTPDGKINKGWSFGNSIEMGYQLGVGEKQAQ